jgi:copper homeostasis protein
MKKILFELCAETLGAALAGERGGAARIELCSELRIGGITPSEALIAATLQAVAIPVHVLIRPRGGDFVYSDEEFERMRRQVDWVRKAGAAGVVLGVLLADGRVDVARSRELVECARPMRVTFHRAFDETPDLAEALEAVIETGADCLLTSGGAQDVLTGAAQIARLVEQARGRIQIMAGGGLRLGNMADVLARTGVGWLHGSLKRRSGGDAEQAGAGDAVLEADVRAAAGLLRI